MDDLLSTYLSGPGAESYVKKIYKLMGLIGFFTVIWTLLNLFEVYKYIDDIPNVSKLPHAFYRYTLTPVIELTELAMNITWIILLYKAWSNLKTYIDTSDDNLLHKGLKDFYSATILLAVWFVISIANAVYTMAVL
ncbi:MAG TPA: hypothetical protein VG847_15785 [Chitinophagaceae bacterium]|nr:hypothetical protein [Chitinophagaceae bacterium]